MKGQRYYRFGDYRFDPDRHILERHDTLVALPPKVLDTLAALIEAAPGFVDKETLFEQIWPGIHVVQSSLTKNISMLRKALGDEEEEGHRFIETLPKRGYRFVAPISVEGMPEYPVAETSRPWRRVQTLAAGALAVSLVALAFGSGSWTKKPAEIPESERQYLIGRHQWSKCIPTTIEQALARFDKAIDLNPRHALAYAGRAEALISLAVMGSRNTPSAAAESLRAARQSVDLDPKSATAHSALALATLVTDFDWDNAEAQYRRAIALNPQEVRPYYGLSRLLAQTGRLVEAASTIAIAERLDPASPQVATRAAHIMYLSGDLEKAERKLRAVLDWEPTFDGAHYYLGMIYGYLGQVDRSLEHLSVARLPSRTLAMDRAWVLAYNGQPQAAEQLLVEFERLKREKVLRRSAGVTLKVVLGRLDEAIAGLHTAISDRESWALDIVCEPRLRQLRTHPGFGQVVVHLRKRAEMEQRSKNMEAVIRPVAPINPLFLMAGIR